MIFRYERADNAAQLVAADTNGTPADRDSAVADYGEGFEAERNSALIIGLLHFFVVFSAPALLWNNSVVDRRSLVVWTIAEACLGTVSLAASWFIRQRQVQRFVWASRCESIGTAGTFSALAWLGADIASATPSKHILMIALIAVTSISASNSTHITRRRPIFSKLIVIVAASYTTAFLVNGEAVQTQARISLTGDDVVRLELPGGGGYGAADGSGDAGHVVQS